MTRTRLIAGFAAIWALAAAILLWIARNNIAHLEMWDPDDYLRLQQVRDWLGGQSFFDITQYRIDPPHGVLMHWSRIVDLPLAGLILLLQPLFGPVAAERITVAAIPLVTLGGSLAMAALAALRLADRRTALLAAMLGATAPLLLFHVLPLRIDHHGWQTMLGLAAIAACFDRNVRRGGIVAGLAAALWLSISLEGLPMAAALAGILALRYLVWGEGERFAAFCAALGLGTLVLFAGLHDRAGWSGIWCDAMSPGWFGPMVAAPIAAALSVRLAGHRGIPLRIAGLAAAGAIGIALLATTAPACLAGPFAQLDPVVRLYWYDNVPEGLPVWRQAPDTQVLLLGFPLIGIAGTILAWRRAATAAQARDWLAMLGLLLAAFAVSLLVQRAGGFAEGCALPGAAWALGRLLATIGGWRRPLFRITGSAAAIVAFSPVGAMALGGLVVPDKARNEAHATPGTPGGNGKTCFAPCTSLAPFAALPPSYVLTGLDLTPRLLITTAHSFAGSGHHRGRDGMRRVLDAFMGPPDVAHRIMRERGMAYVMIDPGGSEADIYAKAAPKGLMALLIKDQAPGWLVPVALPGSTLRLWKRID